MEYNINKREIKLDRKLNDLDKFVIKFCSLLDEYVLVSGYVSIIFGRSRSTEDVDLLIPKINLEDFEKLWQKIQSSGFECLNTSIPKDAFKMLDEHAVRFSEKGRPVPNIEFKLIKNDLDRYSFENKLKVVLKKAELFLSPLESQIAYKLFLAADGPDEELLRDKDIEDARFLYRLFKEKINQETLLIFIDKLNVQKKFRFLQ